MNMRSNPFLHLIVDSVSHLLPHGHRRARPFPARLSREDRLRFAQSIRRFQPPVDETESAHSGNRLLSAGGSFSRGKIRHYPEWEFSPRRKPLFSRVTDPALVASQRREAAQHVHPRSWKLILDAIRVR